MTIKAIFFDIDGTLVPFQSAKWLPSTKLALERLREKGILTFVATGRSKYEIRNEHLRYWRVEKEEIRRLAEKNTPRIYPVQIRQIVRFMYVATNEQCSLGAAVMRYPDFREKVRGMIRGDFYILPSSIHEVILVPESFGLEPERMQEMVKEINQTGVALEEVLSDSVYYFDGEEIRIVAK